MGKARIKPKRKMPWWKFFTGDWLKDPELSKCSPAARGIWMDALCAMVESDAASVTGTYDQLARVLRATSAELPALIEELNATGTSCIAVCNGSVTLTSRRLQREKKQRDATRKRVNKHRCNAPETDLKRSCNGEKSEVRSQKSDNSPTESYPLPPSLQTSEFESAWAEWKTHRRDKRKPLTDQAARMQLRKLEEWGPQRAVAAIEHSIAGGYQGIFEPKEASRHERPNNHRPSAKSGEYADNLPTVVRRL